MRLLGYSLAGLLALSTTPLMAADVGSGSVQLGPTSTVQLGRLSRQGIQQDWTGSESFPGIVGPSTAYAFASITLPFAANAYQTIYYDITFDDAATDLFASAYLDIYNPANLAANWLGDAGSSGNYFGVDARFFDVVVPAGHSLVLVANSTTGTTRTSSANYFVSAFSDTEYDEDFQMPGVAAVPEPATWGMMLVGFGILGAAMRRRRKTISKMPGSA